MGTRETARSAFDVFRLRDDMVEDYSSYLNSFLNIKDQRVRDKVESVLKEGQLWPDPLIQMNPNFAPGESLDSLVDRKVLHLWQLRGAQAISGHSGTPAYKPRLALGECEEVRPSGPRECLGVRFYGALVPDGTVEYRHVAACWSPMGRLTEH